MTHAPSRPIVEHLVALTAAVTFGGAIGFAAVQALGLVAGGAAGVLTALVAAALLARIDRGDEDLAERFVAVDFPRAGDAAAEDDVLLLDDPLPALDEESRVVRLFAIDANREDAPPTAIAAPGEMVARIADFLGATRQTGDPEAQRRSAPADDANAALHAALADIRRSLRHG